MGDTGNAAGIHLHFEARYRGSIVDPNQFFGSRTASESTPIQLEDDLPSMNEFLNTPAFDGGPTISEMFVKINRVDAILTRPVLRDTNGDGANEEISQIQDTADTNSMVRQLLSRAPGTNAPLDYPAIGEAVRNAVFK
jgi:murein DD-endopeptidase MepM/ murein hydrolase activator NlpD